VPPTRTSQDTGTDASFARHRSEEQRERSQTPVSKVDAPDERRAIRPRAEQADRATSAQPSAKPSAHYAPHLNQPGISISSSLSRVAPAITTSMSSWMHTARGILSSKYYSQSGGFHPDLSRLPEQEKGTTYPDERGHTKPSDASHGPPLPPEPAITRVEPYFLPQSESSPHRLGRSKSRILGNERVKRGAMGVAEPPTPEKQRKETTAAGEHETHREDSATNAYGGSRRMAEPTLGGHGQHVKRNPQPTPEGSVERTYSGFNHESDSSSGRPLNARKSRGRLGRPSDSTTSLDGTEMSVTLPAPPSTQNQPKHVTEVPLNNSSTIPSAAHRLQPPNTEGNSQIQTAPSMSPSMSYRAPAPVASRVAYSEGEVRPGPIMPSKPMRPVAQLRSAAVTPAAQDGSPSTRALREIGSEASLKLPGNHAGDSGETHTSSRALVDLTHETGENGPRAKSSDRKGPVRPSGKSSVVLRDTLN